MIYNYKVENFYSIREMQELDFEEPSKYDDSIAETHTGKFINKINCILGNNASGKTNILKALSFVLWFVESSFYGIHDKEEIPYRKHELSKDKPSKFEITFDNKSDLFKLELELDENKVTSEKLSIKNIRGFCKIYSLSRKNNECDISHNRKFLSSINKKDIDRFKARENASYFSFLTGLGYLNELNIKNIVSSFKSNTTFMGRDHLPHFINFIECSRQLERNKSFKTLYLDYINKFDLGISDISLTKAIMMIDDESKEKRKKENLLVFKHGKEKETFDLPVFEESAGTINSLLLLCEMLEVFETGGVMIKDELESSLHPNIVKKLISFFSDTTINTHNAQLIFSTHQPIFLNDRLKRQIFLVEKENTVDTEVFRLDEIKNPSVRNDENFFLKYLSGEYGAVPNIGIA